jgi:hypothetical protein
MQVAESDIGQLAAQQPRRHVEVRLCANDVELAVGSVLTNALRPYAALLDSVQYPCNPPSGEHCACTAILPALATYTGQHTETDTPPTMGDGFLLVPFVDRPSATSVGAFIAFHHRFTAWLSTVLANVRVGWDVRQHITEIAYHAAQNIYDHAYRKPFVRTGPVFSYIAAHVDHEDAARGGTASTAVLRRQQDAGYRLYADQAPKASAHLTLTVNDDGVGIAARHEQDNSIYWGDPVRERDVLQRALTAQQSVKLAANDASIRGIPGQGTKKILTGVRRLQAYATVRTGRYLATIDGMMDDSYRIEQQPRAYMPGTLLNIIIPLVG